MIRHALVALAVTAAFSLAAAPAAMPSGPSPVAASAAKERAKKQTRAQKLRACLKKANRKSGAARRRSRSACQRRFGAAKKPSARQPQGPGKAGTGAPVTPPQPPPAQTPPPPPPPPPPAVDPVRDDAKFREALKSSYFHRQYAVPKPNHGQGFNYHDENYEFCQTIAGHLYEGISYIYKSTGPWEVVEGNINGDGTKGNGTVRFTQATANFAEEVGKVQTIQIQWAGDQTQIVHPEIGTNAFTRQVKPAPCTQ